MDFRILGPVEVVADDGSPVEIGGRRERAILVALLLRAGRVVAADRLIDEVWGERLPANPANALQVRVSRLRKAVGDVVVTRSPGYMLVIDGHRLDAADFERLIDEARTQEPSDAKATLLRALSLVRGEPLADVSEDGGALAGEAARLRDLQLAARESLLTVRLELGEAREIVSELESLVDTHPLRESLRAVLMLALYRAGRQADALRVYGEGRRILGEELGIEPGSELQELEERILLQHVSLGGRGGAVEPVPAPADAGRGVRRDLPARLTSFIGREQEVATLERQLAEGRLVTIVGPGGAGKTSLAHSVGLRAPGDVDTAITELAGVTEAGFVAEQVATSLGLEAGPSGASSDRLILTYFRDRRALLIIDNCEHVLDGVASLVSDILTRCPDVTIIATSRERLGVPGERLLNLTGLDLDDAVRLFCDRAAELGVECSAEDAGVVDTCRRLDGMPLAIELAAALTTTLQPADIAERLDRRFDLLTRGARTALPRHQTLRAAIDWSYDLLDDVHAAVFRRLGVVRSSWDIALAAAVAGIDEATAISRVGALVDRSMVERVGGRFRMLDTLRVFALERLDESGEHRAAVDRFVRHAEGLAALAEPDLRTDRQMVWVERLDPERDNLRHAVELAVDIGELDRALFLCGTLGYHWFTQALVEEELGLVERLLSFDGGSPLARARAIQTVLMLNFIQAVGRSEVLTELADEMVAAELERGSEPHRRWARALRGIAHAMGGNIEVGLAALDETLADALAAGDRWTEGLVRTFAAATRAFDGTDMMRREGLEPAVQCFRHSGDRWMLAFSLGMQATVARQLGEYHDALALLEEGHGLAREVGSRWIESNTMVELGNVSALLGDFAAADRYHLAAEPIAATVGAPGLIGHVANSKGIAARARGSLDAALEHHGRALRVYRSAGGQGGEALALDGMGYTLQGLGRHDEANQCHRQAFELGLIGGDPLAMALSIEGLAGVIATIGEPVEAALLLGAAERLRQSMGVPLAVGERDPVDRTESLLRDRLGDGQLEEVLARGRLLSDGDVVAMIRAE